ncbi:hypothetical protein ADIS_3961 [Lunatimonas lonarensis]|uniref:Uncharacterized protein n=1 Tax=Lunatimonas lonarensis TaxID=1232681 RepID=R7ZNA7_9BACT|nr:hypothetical protein ADIS_3961 [Lunatimonas lonarensis]
MDMPAVPSTDFLKKDLLSFTLSGFIFEIISVSTCVSPILALSVLILYQRPGSLAQIANKPRGP